MIKTKNAAFHESAIFTPIDIATKLEEIKKYLNQPVYLADNLGDLKQRIEERDEFKLKDINESLYSLAPFIHYGNGRHAFCLPADKVTYIEEPKKEYRPFKTFDELYNLTGFGIGDVIVWRFINKHEQIFKEEITGISENTEGELIHVSFADVHWNIKQLFKDMEWQGTDGQWYPFSIEITKE